MAIDTAELIWQWLDTVTAFGKVGTETRNGQIKTLIDLVSDRKIKKADELLNFYILENPKCSLGRLAAAAVYLQKNKLPNVLEQLDFVYKNQPSNTMALYAYGHCSERLGKEAEAVQFYQDCLKFKNHLQLPRQRLAALYFKNGQFEKTINEYEHLRQEYPDDISTLVTLGHLYIAAGLFDKAVEAFNTAILIHPDSFDAGDDNVGQFIGEGLIDQAAEQLDNLIAENPHSSDLLTQKGDILAMMGDTSEAVTKYEQALRIRPDVLETTIKLGTQYLQIGKNELAAQQFNRASEINDRIVDAYIGLAIAQKLNGASSEAVTTLSLAAAIEANTPLLFAQTATLQFREELINGSALLVSDEESLLLKRVIEAHHFQLTRFPQNPDLYYRLGILFMYISDYSSAIKAFQQSLSINPTFSRARYKLAICLFETGRQKDACDTLKAPVCLDKCTLDLHYRIAVMFCDKIRFASSVLNFVNTLEESYTNAEPTVNISLVLQNLGLLDRASIMWENLIDTAEFLRTSGSNY